MGGNVSFFATPLAPQTDFLFKIKKRFCQPRLTTLVLADNFWGRAGADGFAVKDAVSDKVVFRVETAVQGVTPRDNTKWLADAYKIPKAHLDEVWTYTTAYNLFIGKSKDECLTQIEVKYIPMERNNVRAVALDAETGARGTIGTHGYWHQRAAYIFMENGRRERYAIATIF